MQPASSAEERAPNFGARIFDNPVILKELKGRMRGRQGATLLTVYLGLLALFIILTYLFFDSEGSLSRNDPDFLQTAGKILFATVVVSELLMIAFIAPALTSGAISSERERQTFDLLRISLLSPRDMLLGKLGSALAYLLLLIFAAIPLQSLAFFLGGVGVAELLISVALMFASALLSCMLGLYFSTVAKRAMIATTVSYGFVVLPVILLFIALFWTSSLGYVFGDMTRAEERLLMLALWTCISTNPVSAAFVSELMLVEEQTIFLFYQQSLSLALFSPWILYLVYALALTVIMIWLSAFYLKRYEY